jgi:4-phosphopantoate--beta-alanine ligase
MTIISKDHPRYISLVTRNKIIDGVNIGITSMHGLIAQGRGEAFDYLIGEHTTESAMHAQRCAIAYILLAKNPIISVNGNAAALVPKDIADLSNITGAIIEINLFHRSEERIEKIIKHLKLYGAKRVIGNKGDATIPLKHDRGIIEKEGIKIADVVLVPLEDGDRCEMLIKLGKKVITIDLNPMSRTAQASTVSIINNITRAIPDMVQIAKELKHKEKNELMEIINSYGNNIILSCAIDEIYKNLNEQKK